MTESDTGEVRYLLSEGLGSVRQVVDEAGVVVAYQEYSPYGEPVGESETNYGFTGEWFEDDIGLLHLRARWYDPGAGVFLSRDVVESEPAYQYVRGNVINRVDPSGLQPPPWADEENKIELELLTSLKSLLLDTAQRLNNPQKTNMNNETFAAMLGAKIIMEDAYWDAVTPDRRGKRWHSRLPSITPPWLTNLVDQPSKGRQVSWGIMNIPTHLGNQILDWWESGGYLDVGKNKEAFQSLALSLPYNQRPYNLYNPHDLRTNVMRGELEYSDRQSIEYMGMAILWSAHEATTLNSGQETIVLEHQGSNMCRIVYPRFQEEVSAYIIAAGVIHHGGAVSSSLDPQYGYPPVYDPVLWRDKGSQGVWTDAIPDVAMMLSLTGLDYLSYMSYEVEALSDAQVDKHGSGSRIGP